jgi:phosphatidylinositol alpha 1,6-mannosyltransferase
MRDKPIRVALFADSYLEVDGVANTTRQYESYARRNGLPFLLLHGGYEEEAIVRDDAFTRIELPRGRFRFALDRKHDFDLNFIRHLGRVEEILREFAPDVLHITGPSDVGIVGALAAHRLHIPLLASWHTNLHQYAERRAMPLFAFLPSGGQKMLGAQIRQISFRLTARFYQIPRVLMAPNRELIELLENATGKPCFLMARGVDTELFHPGRRNRQGARFTIGYVGRITVEKNVELLVEIEQGLRAAGLLDYQFLIVGQGSSEAFLRSHLKRATFAGVLRGEELARAYANMDVFLFPSKTDTFGNVVLEALSAGTPALVTDQGGPKFIVRHGETGFICPNTMEFVEHLMWLRNNAEELQTFRKNARHQAESASWDSVFRAVYCAYEDALAPAPVGARTGLNVPVRTGTRVLTQR